MQGMIGFGFPFHRLINWCKILKTITKKHSNCNLVITFSSHLKTALTPCTCNRKSCFILGVSLGTHEITREEMKEPKQ